MRFALFSWYGALAGVALALLVGVLLGAYAGPKLGKWGASLPGWFVSVPRRAGSALFGWFGALVVMALAFLLGAWAGPSLPQWLARKPGDSNSDPGAGEQASRSIYALGRLQPASGVLFVMGPPGDRVKRLLRKEGETVKAGEPLVVLASVDDYEKELGLARLQEKEAKRALAAVGVSEQKRLAEIDLQVNNLPTAEKLEEAGNAARIKLLQNALSKARDQQRRVAQLDPNLVSVSAQERDQLDLTVRKAEGELKAAELAQTTSREQYRAKRKLAESQREVALAEFDLARARVPVQSAANAVAVAELKVDRATLKATADGRVLRVLTREGDAVTTQPILEVAAGKEMVAVAEVYASQTGTLRNWLVKPGKVRARVTSPALKAGTELLGTIRDTSAISTMVAPNLVPGFSPRANSDRRVIDVRVPLDAASSDLAREFVGLEVNVELQPATDDSAAAGSTQPPARP